MNEDDPDLDTHFIGSCVGFVEQCFIKAEFPLVDNNTESPEWSLDDLFHVLPVIFHSNPQSVGDFQSQLTQLGCNYPYRPFMPGYQMTAFKTKKYPYKPDSCSDAFLT